MARRPAGFLIFRKLNEQIEYLLYGRHTIWPKALGGMTNTFSNKTHIVRIMSDVREFYRDPPKGIYIVPEEDNICLLHALIIGPPDTPYENGFFYFVLNFPDEYPFKPPKVDLRTTYGKTVRFSPNFYPCGRVCLSILGTWSGPSWSSSQTIFTTLLSIQSLMDSQPYHNEPGYEKQSSRNSGRQQVDVAKDVSDYNDVIAHETLRVAIIEMLQDNSLDAYGMPASLKEIMRNYFETNYDFYDKLIQSKMKFDGKPVRDPHHDYRPQTFTYKAMVGKILQLKEKFSQIENISADLEPDDFADDISELTNELHEPESDDDKGDN